MNNKFSYQKAAFNSEGPIFMGSKRSNANCDICIFGVPYDGTTSFKPGTRFGPDAIRTVSNGLESYCPKLNIDLEEISFSDLGNLEIPIGAPENVIHCVKEATQKLVNLKVKPLMLGGEHSISSGAIEVIASEYPEVIVIQLDAHADLREEWQGTKYSHACAMRRCLEILPSKTIFQLGIRSGTKKEFEELKLNDHFIPLVPGETSNNLRKALAPHLGKPIYITVDLDWFDPSILPGTGTPEPGGFFWQDFEAIVDILKSHKLIAGDIVELSPQIDPSGISSILAAKVTRTLLLLLSNSKCPNK